VYPNNISRNLSRNLVLSSFGSFLDFFLAPFFDGLWMAMPIKGGRAAPERLQEGVHVSCLFFEPHDRGGPPPLLRGTATPWDVLPHRPSGVILEGKQKESQCKGAGHITKSQQKRVTLKLRAEIDHKPEI